MKGESGEVSEMQPRERFMGALRREEMDKVPLLNRYMGPVMAKLAPIYGAVGRELEIKLGNDALMVQIGINAEYSHKVIGEGEVYTSEWGVTYQRVNGFNQPVKHPLREQNLAGYTFPDPDLPARMTEIQDVMARYHPRYAVVVDLSCTLFEAGFHLRGMENFLMDAYENEDFVYEVLEKLAEYYTALGVHAVRQGVDMIRIGDDVGIQTGLVMPTEKWRHLVKPHIERMIRAFREVNPDILVKYHSCGDLYSIIPDLLELKVDLIGTMQPCGQLQDPFRIKQEFGQQVSFLGGLDVQQLLPFGSPAQVREGVRTVLKAYAPGGGYIFMPAHYINVDVPLENIWALLQALSDFRDYPLQLD